MVFDTQSAGAWRADPTASCLRDVPEAGFGEVDTDQVATPPVPPAQTRPTLPAPRSSGSRPGPNGAIGELAFDDD